MTTAEKAKAYGFKSLQEVADMSGWSTKVLRDWDKEKPQRLEIVLLGCNAIKLKKVV